LQCRREPLIQGISTYTKSPSQISNGSTRPGLETWALTLIEYAVPRMKFMKRTENRGCDPTAHPRPKLFSHFRFRIYLSIAAKTDTIATLVEGIYSPDAVGRVGLLN